MQCLQTSNWLHCSALCILLEALASTLRRVVSSWHDSRLHCEQVLQQVHGLAYWCARTIACRLQVRLVECSHGRLHKHDIRVRGGIFIIATARESVSCLLHVSSCLTCVQHASCFMRSFPKSAGAVMRRVFMACSMCRHVLQHCSRM